MAETLARIRGKADRVRQMMEKSSLIGRGSDPYHEEIYLNIQDGQVHTLGSSAGNSAIAYCTFSDAFLDEVETNEEGGTEAIVNIADFMSYFDFASNGKTVEVRFTGDPDRLATSMEIEGKLLSTVMLPVSEAISEKVPTGVVERFQEGEKWDGDHVFMSNSGDEPTTQVRTNAEEVRSIIATAEHHDKEFYPFVVEDGELQINVGVDEERNSVRGSLTTNEVGGKDVSNQYLHGFPEVFESLSGELTVRLAPNAPASIIQEGDGYVYRHVLAAVQ